MSHFVAPTLHPCITGNDSYSHPTTISSFDISGKALSDLKIATGDVSSVESEATMPKNQKPLRKRGAGASIGEIERGGNHKFEELRVPAMIETGWHSHPTPLGLIPQSPSGNRRLSADLMQDCNIFRSENSRSGKSEAQGEVA